MMNHEIVGGVDLQSVAKAMKRIRKSIIISKVLKSEIVMRWGMMVGRRIKRVVGDGWTYPSFCKLRESKNLLILGKR